MADDARTSRPSSTRTTTGPSSGAGIAAWAIIALLIAFIGGMLLSPWFERQVRPRLPFVAQESDLGAVNARLDQQELAIERLETRVAAVESRPAPTALPAPAQAEDDAPRALNDPITSTSIASDNRVGPLEARVDALDRQQASLGNRVDNLSAEVAGLTVRVEDSRGEAASRTREAQEIARDARTVLVIGQARSAFEAGRPLGDAESALRTLLGPDADRDVNRLAAGLQTLQSPAELVQRWDALAPRLLERAQEEGGEGSGWDSFLSGLANIFQVRREGEVDELRSNEVILDRITAALERRDIDTAAAEYQRLPQVVQDRGARWERDAVRYVQTRRALERLEAQIANGEADTPQPATNGEAVPL